MMNFLITSEIVVCIVLIISIILQDSKNTSVSDTKNIQTYFKPKGKDAFLNKVINISAILLFLISIMMIFVK